MYLLKGAYFHFQSLYLFQNRRVLHTRPCQTLHFLVLSLYGSDLGRGYAQAPQPSML